MGAIAWLDLHRDDLARARDLLRALQDESVLDELGFLALHTAFADRLYPATATPMSSSRYLYFVAAVYRHLERERTPARTVDRLARDLQDELRAVLANHHSTGVIGKQAGRDVKLPPSTVYWNALRQLGFFRPTLSEAAYQDRFDESARGFADDDKIAHAAGSDSFWDPNIPPPAFFTNGTFRSDTKFALTRAEADDLASRFRTRFPDSLLTLRLETGQLELPRPWDAKKASEPLPTLLHHARALGLLAGGTTLHYTYLLDQERKRHDLPAADADFDDLATAWWKEAEPILRTWQPSALAALPGIAPSLRDGDVRFATDWLARMRAHRSGPAVLRDGPAKELVIARERRVKPGKARFKNRKQLERWTPNRVPTDPYGLHYRHLVGSRFVREILEGRGARA